ncbi:MAG: iron complex outermembrane receptor protein [Woeseiaceae bacterium]|jgi:iron complex outermembrane receptor protein
MHGTQSKHLHCPRRYLEKIEMILNLSATRINSTILRDLARTFAQAILLVAGLGLSLGAVAKQDIASEITIEEIIVTATKRAQTLQEIPIAVTVVDADTIQKAQIVDIKDLQFIVPGLRISQLETAGNTSFFIRGFGNGSNNIGIEPSVGVFIDGVYRSRTASAIADFPTLERIEVLRGPQSTLFGKNASAGVISVVTAKPDLDEYSGSAAVTVGDYSQFIVKGDITGPISDTVAFSLAGSSHTRDGYFTNLADGSDINNIERFGIRGQLLWEPSENLEFRLIADHDELDEFCCGTVNIDAPVPGSAQIIGLIGGQVLTEDPFSRSQYYNYNPPNKLENDGVSLQMDWDIGSVTLTSITSSRSQTRLEDADSDFTSADLLSTVAKDIDIDTFTQELRLTSSGDGAFDWMIGGFYFDEELKNDNTLFYGQDFRAFGNCLTGGNPATGCVPSGLDFAEAALAGIPGVVPGAFEAPGTGYVEAFAQDNTSFSIFGQVDIPIGDRVTLTLGANYTEDEKDVSMNIVTTDLLSAIDFIQLAYGQAFVTQTGLPPTPANIAAEPVADATSVFISTTLCTDSAPPLCNPLLPLQDAQFLPPFMNFPNAVEPGKTKDDDTTWTARLAFDWTDSVNVYVGAATGFKASSWNLTRNSRPFEEDMEALGAGPNVRFGAPPNLVSGSRYAGPEEATAYEIGLKSRFDRGSINVAVFDQEIEGFQSAIFIGTGFVLSNAGKQSTTGLELEANFAPLDSLSFSFSGTWMDPKYDSFENAEGPNGPMDLSGQNVAGVSEFSMNLSGIWSFDVFSSASGFIRAEYVFDDEVQVVENIPADILSREVSTINASVGIAWENGFEVMLWGRNINDDEYLTSGFPTTVQFDRTSAYPNQPRTYGLTLTKRFN